MLSFRVSCSRSASLHRAQEDVRQTVLIHLFEPSLDVLSAVIRHSPGTDSAAVATSLVLLLQQSQRTEEFLRRELTARLQNARCTWTRTFRPDCVPLLILAMLPSQRTPAVGTGAVTNILRDNRYSSPRPIPPSRSKPAFPSLSFASHTPASRSE